MKTANVKCTMLLLLTFAGSFLFGQNVGIGQASPVSKLDVNGGLSVGAGYSGSNVAPANGAIVQGRTGLGTPAPAHQLHVVGDVRFEGDFINQSMTSNVLGAGQNVAFNAGTAVVNNSVVSITIPDGNGVNHSGVLVFANADVYSSSLAWSTDYGVAAGRIELERAEDAGFTVNRTVLNRSSSIIALKVSDYNNGLGSSSGNYVATHGLAGNLNVTHMDLGLVQGTTYYYRLIFRPLYINTPTSGAFSILNSQVSLLQIKR